VGSPAEGTLRHVTYASHDGVARIVLARPDTRNALGIGPRSSRAEIEHCLDVAEADESVRCVLISAEGPSFCAGGDLSGLPQQPTPMDEKWFIEEVDRFHRHVRTFPKPLIAAVQGHCLGAGLSFALQCDIVLAGDDGRFGLPEGRFGHPGAVDLATVAGPALAKFLIFSGELLEAAAAVRFGIALTVIPVDRLGQRSEELAARIARMPADALRLNKAAIDAAAEVGGREAGRHAGRALDLITKVMSHQALAPDGRTFDEIIQTEGVRGMRAAQREQFTGSWWEPIDD
jgi:enoyl-CoA hydratase/carnithine racemase